MAAVVSKFFPFDMQELAQLVAEGTPEDFKNAAKTLFLLNLMRRRGLLWIGDSIA
jgi:hypothetical protein